MSCQEPWHTSWFCSWLNSLEFFWFRGKGGCIHNVGSLSLRGRSWRCCNWLWLQMAFFQGPTCVSPWGRARVGHMFIAREFDTAICQPQSHVLAVATLYPLSQSNNSSLWQQLWDARYWYFRNSGSYSWGGGWQCFSAEQARWNQVHMRSLSSPPFVTTFLSGIPHGICLHSEAGASENGCTPCMLLVTPSFSVWGSSPLCLFSAISFSNLTTSGSIQSSCDICFLCPLGVNVLLSFPSACCGRMTALGQDHLYVLREK